VVAVEFHGFLAVRLLPGDLLRVLPGIELRLLTSAATSRGSIPAVQMPIAAKNPNDGRVLAETPRSMHNQYVLRSTPGAPMKNLLVLTVALAILVMAKNVQAAEPQVAHMVYFKLKERTPAGREKLAAACKKHLSGHEGTVYFSAGILAEEFKREVNDQDFDVALNLVFENKAAHDKYQDHERHLKFIEENRETWAKVRVFDSYVKVTE
jgi:hypothetical protein